MLEETVRHFLQRETDVLQADLLADHVERHVGKAVMHRAHHAREDRAIADAGIEDAHRRRGWMLPSSSATRLATTHFSEQVLTNSRYFCRLSKNRKFRCGSSAPGAIATGPSPRCGARK